jgi:hypothetical protein
MKTPTMDKTWTKYEYLCTDCDALTEVTTVKNLDNYRGWCSCGSANIIRINKLNVTEITHQ